MDQWAHDALHGKTREVPIGHGRLSMLATARCDEVVAQLSERIREWCRARGMRPHNSLDVVASLALAMAASGMPLGPVFYQELARRAQTFDTPDGLTGLAAAAQQVIDYLADNAPPLGP